jgi:predicted DCC family thiol-disulfide oxidoreductase YuxK
VTAGRHLVLYDGTCGLCDRSVRFLLPRDRRAALRFAPLQGDLGRRIVAGMDPRIGAGTDTFVLVEDRGTPRERLRTRGWAAVFSLRALGGPWALVAALLAVLPRGVLDAAYDVVARARYRIFGRYDACLSPPEGWRERFTDA